MSMANMNDFVLARDSDSEEDGVTSPLYVGYLFDDHFVVNEDNLTELLSGLINSNDPDDTESLNDIIGKMIDHSDEEAFTCLLNCGYKIETINREGQTAIHLAYKKGFLKEFHLYKYDHIFLEDKIGSVNYVDSDGLSLLHIVCDIGYEDAVKRFLDNKVEVNGPYIFESFGDEDNEEECYDNGFTPLHFAVKNLRFRIVKLLVDHGADVNATDLWSRTPLHLASQIYVSAHIPTQDLEIMELLIENKSAVNSKNAFGNTPLHAIFEDFKRSEWVWTCRRGKQMRKLEILLNHGADVTEVNNDGDSVLHRIVKNLKPVRGSDCDRSFADDSHQAQLIAKVLTFGPNIDVNAENKRGRSPLDLAISRLSSDIVAVLLEHKADCSRVKFKDKKSYFKCQRVVPNLDQVRNLTRIIALLIENDFKITEKDDVAILKYLVHNFDDCKCWHRRLHKSNALRDNVTNLFNYGSTVHVSRVLNRLIESDQRKTYAFNDVILDIAAFHLKCLKYGNLFVHRQVEEGINNYFLANDYNKSEYSHWDVKLKNEITQMKFIILKDKLSIFDVMTMPPNKIYKYFKNVKIDWAAVDKLSIYRNIIKGHVTRSLVRTYLEESTFERLKSEFFPLLFDHLCEEIFIYLSNEDILNMNLALMSSD